MDRKLINYLPPVLRDIIEFVTITDAQQFEINKAWDALDFVMNNQFIDSASEEGISIMEKEYGIVPKSQDLDTRKFILRTKQHEKPINSYKSVHKKLSQLCGEDNFQMSVNGYTIEIKLGLGISDKYDAVIAMLKEIVPANMCVKVQIMYNKQSVVSQYTYSLLSSFTHSQLRNEVFN